LYKKTSINAHQFNNQLIHRSITKLTNVGAEICTRVLHDSKRALFQLSYQPDTVANFDFGKFLRYYKKLTVVLALSKQMVIVLQRYSVHPWNKKGLLAQKTNECLNAN
jgi:hypothetical protein